MQLYIIFYKRSFSRGLNQFSAFNQNRMREAQANTLSESSIALYTFVLMRILSAMIARCPWRINWSHLALAINLARVRWASGRCPRARASQRGATLLSPFLLITGCRRRYPPPRFWRGRTIEMTVVDRMGAYRFSIYRDGHECAREFRLGARLGALAVVVRDGDRVDTYIRGSLDSVSCSLISFKSIFRHLPFL